MKLLIRDIPHEGQNFEWTKNKIHIKGFIYPIKGGFDLHGEIDAYITMDCSFCANPLEIPVKEKFHEIIMLHIKNHAEDKEIELHKDDAEFHYVEGPEIDLEPIIQQIVDVSLPLQPKCIEKGGPVGSPHCVADWDYQKYFDQFEDKPLANPFEVLKKLKKN